MGKDGKYTQSEHKVNGNRRKWTNDVKGDSCL